MGRTATKSKSKSHNTNSKTTAKKQLGGTHKKSREIIQVPPADPNEVNPLWPEMTSEEISIFNWLKRILTDLKVLHFADSYVMQKFATDMILLKEARAELMHEKNFTDVTDKGTTVLSGEFLAYKEMSKIVESTMRMLPVSPKQRKVILAGVFQETKEIIPKTPMQRPQLAKV